MSSIPSTSRQGGEPQLLAGEEALVVTPVGFGPRRSPSPSVEWTSSSDEEEVAQEGEQRERVLSHGEACSVSVDEDWIGRFNFVNGPQLFEEHYDFGTPYCIVAPEVGQSICCPPPGHIGVYIRQLEYGLRFPLNEHVAAIISRMNVAVGQLHPLAVRTIIAFVWLCLYKGVVPSVNLFRRLHHLRPSTMGVLSGWYSVQTEAGYVTCTKLTSCKDWKDRWVYVQVPEDFPLPRTFQSRVFLRCETQREREKYVSRKKLKLDAAKVHLTEEESHALGHFEAERAGLSKEWMPPTQIILQDEPLCFVGLIPALRKGQLGRYGAPLVLMFHHFVFRCRF